MSSPLKYLAILLCLLLPSKLLAQTYTIKGTVTDKSTGGPVEFATIVIEATEQWAVADSDGHFTISGVRPVRTAITVSCLGYETDTKIITVSKDIPSYKVSLELDNLALEGAVVTAKEKDNSATTSRTIDKAALEHVQMMNVSDISSLLPGGATTSNDLTGDKHFDIRGGGAGESGNSSFGTAVEVDGVRLSNNASYSDIKGVSTNNIASANVESVEVISGVPSVEYGDMGAGIVKINTKKGKTPWSLTMSSSPRTKQVSVSKGFGLGVTKAGAARGVLNSSLEYTRSVSDQMSPYTSYLRRNLSLTYSNLISRGAFASRPLRFSIGVSGNLGGLDDSADPDKFLDVFIKQRDNTVRANINANWLLSLPWITNIELNASTVYSDRLTRENKNYHTGITQIAMHSPLQGYLMSEEYREGAANGAVMIPPGSWYNVMAVDDRPLTSKITLKANWARNFGKLNNKLKIGGDWNLDHNFGVGVYSEDPATAPTFREYRYCDNPSMNNFAAYLEDNLMIPIGGGHLNLIAGVRCDNTYIKGSAYGLTSSFSPRFNAKYNIFGGPSRRRDTFRSLTMRASWGVAVKQPAFSILYPVPSYMDINVFTSTASADNVVHRAFYVQPRSIEYNAALRWQKNHQSEFGIDADIAGNKVSLVAFYNKTIDAYLLEKDYERFSYSYTSTADVQGLPIPAADRIYTLDPASGVVTVSDKTGSQPSIQAPYRTWKQFISTTTEENEVYPITRYGLEWVVDFKEIRPIHTTIRLDGNFYSYRSCDYDIGAYYPEATVGYDGLPFRYVGYYVGGNAVANGRETRTIHNNITITTHIPKVRMILSFKLESCLLNYSCALSEKASGRRSYVVPDRSDLLGYSEDASIYAGESYTVMFPDYYVSFDDPNPQPFLEKLKWARTADPALYSDLSKLVVTSNYLYHFSKDYISPYFSANVSVTKEIGDLASISFYANNFFNNSALVWSTKTKTYSSLTRFIPSFYYGITVRFKF